MGWMWHCLVSCWVCYSLLFFVIAEEQLEPGDPSECKNADFVPGYNLGGEGFDIVKMKRKGSYVIDMEKWDTGNGSCQMFQNLYMNKAKQKIPVAVVFWRTLPKCSMKVDSQLYESSEALVNDSTTAVSNNWKIGLNLPCTAGISFGGTHSREAQFGMKKSKEDKFSFTKHKVKCSYYSYQIAASPPLHREFLQAVESLPAQYDPHTYQSFIDRFGTHYTTGVDLGGKMKAVTAISDCKSALNGLTATAVKDCLEVEASASYNSVNLVVGMKHCQELRKKMNMNEDFSSVFSEREAEVVGGNINNGDLLFSASSNPNALKEWLESLKEIPDVVKYSLKPLHLLLKDKDRTKNLKKAIEVYIRDNALKKVCSESCKIGRQISARDPCACVCETSQDILSNCCPAESSLARLKVFKLHAKGLYGDVFSKTDGFVIMNYGEIIRRTAVITDDNDPHWKETFDFGPIQISASKKLTFQVYDENTVWVNDLLGECSFDLRSGRVDDMCVFKYGTFYFSYSVECAPGLQGQQCADYSPSPVHKNLAKIFDSRNGILTKGMWKFQEAKNLSSKISDEEHYGKQKMQLS